MVFGGITVLQTFAFSVQPAPLVQSLVCGLALTLLDSRSSPETDLNEYCTRELLCHVCVLWLKCLVVNLFELGVWWQQPNVSSWLTLHRLMLQEALRPLISPRKLPFNSL